MQKILIDESIFLDCYKHLFNDKEFFDITFLYGGRDSGKSRHVAQQLLVECMRANYFKCLLIRKVLNTVRDSQFDLIKSIIDEWGIARWFNINESRMEIIYKPNGNGFYGRGLDDVGRIKSFNNPSHCWIEEGNQITSDDFVVILTSLRADQRVKTWFSFNPECEMNYTDFWLWQEWFSHTTDLSWTWTKIVEVEGEQVEFKARATHTTYKDNPFCKPQRKALYESYKSSKNNAYWYQTYTLGLWGYKRTGGEFWKCFEESKHVKDIEIDSSVIWVIADNNVNPYLAIQFWQTDIAKRKLKQIYELPCTHPDNTAVKAARRTAQWLRSINYKNAIYVGGDPSANAKSTVDDNGKSFFDKFIEALRKEGFVVNPRIQRSAPEVALSGSFINEIYESNYLGWSIEIDSKCRVSIEDYVMAKEDAEGKILKKRQTDPDTKVSYEKHGHFCVIGETMINTNNGDKAIKDIKIGDMVLTRQGFKKVTNQVLSFKNKQVFTYDFGHAKLTCTDNHKIFTDNDFKRASSLTINDMFCIFDKEKNQLCKKKLSLTMAEIFIDTLMRNLCRTGDILKDGFISMADGKKNISIDICGSRKGEKFLKVIIFTIMMAISTIIQSTTFVFFLIASIFKGITIASRKNIRIVKQNCLLIWLRKKQKNGTDQTRVENGIANMQEKLIKPGSQKNIIVNIVKKYLNQNRLTHQNFVQTIANPVIEEKRVKTWRRAIAQFVELNLNAINIQRRVLVHGNVPHYLENKMDVYDISVEGAHEFVANDILIHNSDDKRYFITTVLAAEFNQYKSRGKKGPISVPRINLS